MIFAFKDCELDTDRYELRRRGVPCPVEPRVLDLLLYLVENCDRLVTKEEILQRVWPGRFVSDSALSAGISAARRAIGDGGPGGRLRTVFRRGFRFVGLVERRTPAAATDEVPRTAVCGHFITYSHAWSPAFEGRLVRGMLTIQPGVTPRQLEAVYAESLPSGQLRHRGPIAFIDRVMYLDLVDPDVGSRVFLALLAPGPAATALVGLMLGRVFHDPNPEIAVTRLVAVRLPGFEPAVLDGSEAYVHPAEESLSADLERRGVPLAASAVLDSLLHGFLASKEPTGFVRVTAADHLAVSVGVDRAVESGRAGPRGSASGRRTGHGTVAGPSEAQPASADPDVRRSPPRRGSRAPS